MREGFSLILEGRGRNGEVFINSFENFGDDLGTTGLVMCFLNKEHLFRWFVLTKDEIHLGERNEGIIFGGDEDGRAVYLLNLIQVYVFNVKVSFLLYYRFDVF